MKSYTQLTREQRYQIYALKSADHTPAKTPEFLVGIKQPRVLRTPYLTPTFSITPQLIRHDQNHLT